MTYLPASSCLAVFLGLFFAGIVYVLVFYFGNRCAYCWGLCSYNGYFVCSLTYNPLMERMLIFGTVKLWHVTAVILFIDLMQWFVR
jgi:hypothetical protein